MHFEEAKECMKIISLIYTQVKQVYLGHIKKFIVSQAIYLTQTMHVSANY